MGGAVETVWPRAEGRGAVPRSPSSKGGRVRETAEVSPIRRHARQIETVRGLVGEAGHDGCETAADCRIHRHRR